jgi:Fe-S cluster assembly protein SufD
MIHETPSGVSSPLFTEEIANLEHKLDSRYPAWLNTLRHTAFASLLERGFPTVKDEDWRYTRVASILATPFKPAKSSMDHLFSCDAIDKLAGDFGGIRLVFVNGHFMPTLSSSGQFKEGIQIESLATILSQGQHEATLSRLFNHFSNAFTALNLALTEDGAFIFIPPNTIIEEPIAVVFLSDASITPFVSNPRSVIIAGAGSRATVIEVYTGILDNLYFTNAVTDILLEEGAKIDHYKVQNETHKAFHIALLNLHQERGSQFSSHLTALGATIGRHEVRVSLNAEGAETNLNGLYLAESGQYLDNPVLVLHHAPRCTSRQLYKGVIDGDGRGGFYGRIVVAQDAMKTDAVQANKVLLLSDLAQADTRPRLEIFADDVKCAHGATVGQLDDASLFYLRSRGIPLDNARSLLTYAFVSEMLSLVRVKPLQAYLTELTLSRFAGRALERSDAI